VNVATCSECSKNFSNADVDEIQTNTGLGKSPIVPTLTAARMLGRPGQADWVFQELRCAVFPHNGSYFVRLSEIRSYADQTGITVVPLGSNDPTVWA
jgi:hypothetical protein